MIIIIIIIILIIKTLIIIIIIMIIKKITFRINLLLKCDIDIYVQFYTGA